MIEERIEEIHKELAGLRRMIEDLLDKVEGDKNLYNLKDAARNLGMSTPTLRKYVRAGRIETKSIPGSTRCYFTKRAISEFQTQK